MLNRNYVLITAARDEEGFIEETIKSVISQSLLPQQWIIADNNSTDQTFDIILKYAQKFNFITPLKVSKGKVRNFASKVYAIKEGEKFLEGINFDFIGNLDADVTFDEKYYKLMLTKFDQNPKLGIGGGDSYDIYDGKKVKIFSGKLSVRGAIQLFRKECYVQMGGLIPLKYGGEDGVACISARMYGWEVKTFEDIIFYHHRRTGTSDKSIWKARFEGGKADYYLGYLPFYILLKVISRLKRKPYILGSILWFAGYWLPYIKKEKRTVSNEFLTYHKEEQTRIIKKLFSIWKLERN